MTEIIDIGPIRKAIMERDAFLEANPQLKPFQAQIENGMKKCKDQKERMEVLQDYMLRWVKHMEGQFKNLNAILQNAKLEIVYARLMREANEEIKNVENKQPYQ